VIFGKLAHLSDRSAKSHSHTWFLCTVRKTPKVVKEMTKAAYDMLTTWKHSYLETRAKIEASGRDQRWEFDRRRLFERTDYCAMICSDLRKTAMVCGISSLRFPSHSLEVDVLFLVCKKV
jgi:hypothetical protein